MKLEKAGDIRRLVVCNAMLLLLGRKMNQLLRKKAKRKLASTKWQIHSNDNYKDRGVDCIQSCGFNKKEWKYLVMKQN